MKAVAPTTYGRHVPGLPDGYRVISERFAVHNGTPAHLNARLLDPDGRRVVIPEQYGLWTNEDVLIINAALDAQRRARLARP